MKNRYMYLVLCFRFQRRDPLNTITTYRCSHGIPNDYTCRPLLRDNGYAFKQGVLKYTEAFPILTLLANLGPIGSHIDKAVGKN